MQRFYLLFLSLALSLFCTPPTWASGKVANTSNNDAPITGESDSKTVYQDFASTEANYLDRRQALVGHNCMVNRLNTAVSVGSGTAGFGNLVDKDLTNAATFINGVSVGTGDLVPSITIKDVSRTYAKGTTAGFVVSVETSLLKVDAIKLPMRIYFYNDGKQVGYKDCEEKGGSVLQLSLANISKDTRIELTAQSDWDFDEIGICTSGADVLSADVISALKIYYAFVGKNGKYYLDNESGVGIDAYKQATGFTGDITLSTWPKNASYLTDNDPNNKKLLSTIIDVGAELDVLAYSADGLPFKKGMEAGVEYGSGGIKVLSGSSVKLYNAKPNKKHLSGYEWDEVNSESNFSGSLVDVNLGAEKTTKSVVAEGDFNAIGLKSGVGVNLGATVVYRMFVVLPPSIDDDDPHLSVSADRSLCDEHQSLTLHSNEDVTWTCKNQPTGSSVTIGECTTTDNKTWNCEVSGFKYAGTYTFTATAKDGSNRTAETNVTYGISPVIDTAIRPWVNNFTEKGVSYNTDGEGYMKKYKITSFSLIPEIVTDKDNLVTPSLDDYVSAGGISLANDKMLCGVFRSVPYSYDGTNNDKVTVGFVTRTKWNALNLSLLNGLEVRVYNSGSKVTTISSSNSHFKVLSADLIGGDKYVTTEYSVEVDKETPFDAITLWSAGALDLSASDMNVYYAFVEPSAKVNSYNNSVASSWQTISHSQTGAYLDANLMGSNIGIAKVATSTSNLTDIIDDDLTTGATFEGLASVGNSNTIAVNLGKVYDGGHQVQILTSEQNWVNVGVAKFVTLKAYRNGEVVSKKTNWNVLDVNVIGGMNKESEILWTPVDENNKPVDFDEISITFTGVADVIKETKLYGIRITNDADGDGIPDVDDDESCDNPFLIDENESAEGLVKAHDFVHGKLNLRRYMQPDFQNRPDGQWFTICLPVDLTFNQFVKAFGNNAKLAKPEDFNDDMPGILLFNIGEVYGNNVLLQKNTPYIIKLCDGQTLADVDKSLSDEIKKNDDEVKGYVNAVDQVYKIQGVDYLMSQSEKTTADDIICKHSVKADYPDATWHGTFVKWTELPEGFYTFSADGCLTKYNQSVGHFRGLRCWMTENGTAAAKPYAVNIFGDETNVVTGIHSIENNTSINGNIYSLDGQLIKENATSTVGLPQGVYIWNHKKVIIK